MPSRYYIVREGDSLSSIAIKLYGDASRWISLGDSNKITDPRELKVGKRLKY